MPFWKPKQSIDALLTTLEALGYYKYTPIEAVKHIKDDTIRTRNIFGWPETQRIYHADAEDLAEGYAFAFIEEIQLFLQLLGLQIDTLEQVFENDRDYTISINNNTFVIYSVQEEEEAIDLWELSAIRVFGLINHLLISISSHERVYMLYGGNDCHAVFLSPEMFQAIVDGKVLSVAETPIPIPPLEAEYRITKP